MNDGNRDGRERVTLPQGLSMRIASVVGDQALGYGSLQEFVHAAIRAELDHAERKRFHLGREGPR